MITLGIIPARYHSSRFIGKPLADIKGKPMIQHVFENASKATKLDQLIIATDDQRIKSVCQEFGAQVIMTSTEHNSGTERCNEVLKKMTNVGVVVNIQGDEPLIDPKQIDQLIELIEQDHCQIATLIKPIKDHSLLNNPNRVKVVVDNNKKALYFSRAAIPHNIKAKDLTKDNLTPNYKHLGMYAYKAEVLQKLCNLAATPLEQAERLEQLRWIESGYTIHTAITNIETPAIDTPEDLENLNKLLNEQ